MNNASISYFLENSKNFARSNRYAITFTLPAGINYNGPEINSESTTGSIRYKSLSLNRNNYLSLMCNSCTLPAKNLLTDMITQASVPYMYPYSIAYSDPVTFTFYEDVDLTARHFFEIWMSAIVNLNDNTCNYSTEYTSNLSIWQLDRNDNLKYNCTLYDCYPTTIHENQYAYASRSDVVISSVTIIYKFFKSNNDTTRVFY